MNFKQLIQIVGDEPVFETGLPLAGDVDPIDVRPFLEPSADLGLLSLDNLLRVLG
jgi:hypothetical protein